MAISYMKSDNRINQTHRIYYTRDINNYILVEEGNKSFLNYDGQIDWIKTIHDLHFFFKYYIATDIEWLNLLSDK